jgi:hypothetical protein
MNSMATCTCEKLADGEDAQSAAAAPTERRELDARTSDALHVRLLWDPISDRVTVTVADSRTGVEFEIPVGEDENPLDVFRHPFAHTDEDAIEGDSSPDNP